MKQYILAIDQGTTSSRSIIFDHGGGIAASAAIKAASTMAAQAIPEDTIKLGDINARMKGLSVNAEFMTKVIGIKPLDIKGRAVVFASSQWPDIKAGIIKFVESL